MVRVELHDIRTSPDLMKGGAGLDVQGFTYVQHISALALSGEQLSARGVEEVYKPEMVELILRLTGDKTVVINNIAFRRKLAGEEHKDPTYYFKKGSHYDRVLARMPRDEAFGELFWKSVLRPLRYAVERFLLLVQFFLSKSLGKKATRPSSQPAMPISTSPCKVCAIPSAGAAGTSTQLRNRLWMPRRREQKLHATRCIAHG